MPPNKGRSDLIEMEDEYKKAEYALQVRRYDLAIEIMRKVLSVHPENSVAFHTIARAYVFKKDTANAIDAVREALKLDAGNSSAHTLYGSLLSDTDKKTEAEREFLTSLKIDPANHITHYAYASFLLNKKKDIDGAKEHARRALELDPADAKYHLVMARILAEEGDLDQAELSYLRALSLEPDNFRVLNSYGVHMLNKRNNASEAFEYFRQAMMRAPDDPEIRKNFFVALKTKNKWYSLIWYLIVLKIKLGRAWWIVITLFLLGFVIISARLDLAAKTSEVFDVVRTSLDIALFLVCIYVLAVEMIINFLIKRGRLK